MIYPKPHAQESLRLKSLRAFSILDSAEEKEYDAITAKASKISDAPIALISLIDENRQWFKSHYGLNVRETSREQAFCAHAINSNKSVFIIPDARIDPRFNMNPLVTGSPDIVFYAGVVLKDNNQMPLGTLCVIDKKQRHLNEFQLSALQKLAQQVMFLLKKRRKANNLNVTIDNLRKQNKELEQFAFELAHDLKSPINNIGALGDYLKSSYADVLDEDGNTIVSLIQRSTNQLKNLIDDTVNHYVAVNKIQEKFSNIHLNEFFNQIFELFSQKPTINFKLNTTVQEISFNQNTLKQIMINLISNAIRYNDKKKVSIEVGVSENNHFSEFYVEDNGPGIPEELHEKVFQLFTIGQINDKNGEKSNGIGLATVRKLIERLGGTIWIENAKEEGCKFIFRIPNILKPMNLN